MDRYQRYVLAVVVQIIGDMSKQPQVISNTAFRILAAWFFFHCICSLLCLMIETSWQSAPPTHTFTAITGRAETRRRATHTRSPSPSATHSESYAACYVALTDSAPTDIARSYPTDRNALREMELRSDTSAIGTISFATMRCAAAEMMYLPSPRPRCSRAT